VTPRPTALRRALVPLLAGLIGLAGSLGATLFLYRGAAAALELVLEERLRGAGETTAVLFTRSDAGQAELRAVMAANGLEGAYLLGPGLHVVADATGVAGGPANLLRVDAARAARAFAGQRTVAFTYAVGDLPVATGYFPVRGPGGEVRAVLALEAGQEFGAARAGLQRALFAGVGLSALGALTLAFVAWRWAVTEEDRREAGARAERGDALARMAAMVAHEVRNPVGVIRGAAELVKARSGAALLARDREALDDVLGEVERLRRLTEDFLDLTREPALMAVTVDLADAVAEATRGLARSHPAVTVGARVEPLRVQADPGRLRQVLANLLLNAAQAGAAAIELRGEQAGSQARLEIRDDGRGIEGALRSHIFDPFASGRAGGVGLGLAISRRIVERHGGALRLLEADGPGAAFELTLPLAPEEDP